jgi:hypothetical protein
MLNIPWGNFWVGSRCKGRNTNCEDISSTSPLQLPLEYHCGVVKA